MSGLKQLIKVPIKVTTTIETVVDGTPIKIEFFTKGTANQIKQVQVEQVREALEEACFNHTQKMILVVESIKR